MRTNFGRILFVCLLTLTPFVLFSQAKISIRIEGNSDDIYCLLKSKSDKTYTIIDTSFIKGKKNIFYSEKNYEEGIYLITDVNQNPITEILIGDDQEFTLTIENLMDLTSYKVKGSRETSDYFKIFAKTTKEKIHIQALEYESEFFPDNRKKIDSIKVYLNDYYDNFVSENDSSFLSTYISFNRQIIVPEEYKNNEKEYIVNHFFDEVRLCDRRILNSRLLKNKLDFFFDYYLADEGAALICENIDRIISKTESCIEVRDYILWYLYSKYFTKGIDKNDIIYIHLSENYFSKTEIKNLTESIRNEIVKRAENLKNLTIGHQAPHFVFQDEEGNTIDFKEVNSDYTVLFFYKTSCGKCMKEKRILEAKIKTMRESGVKIELVNVDITEENTDNIIDTIVEKYDIISIPSIYLLDADKKITAKNFKAEDIENKIIK